MTPESLIPGEDLMADAITVVVEGQKDHMARQKARDVWGRLPLKGPITSPQYHSGEQAPSLHTLGDTLKPYPSLRNRYEHVLCLQLEKGMSLF